jgi:membrane protease YdiL (CAAX protease family)
MSDVVFITAGAMALVLVIVCGRLSPALLRAAPPRHTGLGPMDLAVGAFLLVIGPAFALGVLAWFGLGTLGKDEAFTADEHATRTLLGQVLGYGPVVLYMLARVLCVERGLREAGFVPRAGWRECRASAVALPAALMMVIGLNTLVTELAQAVGFDALKSGHGLLTIMQESESWAATVALIVSAVVVAPLVEEIIFRGLVQSALLDLVGRERRWRVIACAALLFATIHVGPTIPWQVLPGIFVLGLVLGWLYERHGSLLPSILLHAGFNACNVAMALSFEMQVES